MRGVEEMRRRVVGGVEDVCGVGRDIEEMR